MGGINPVVVKTAIQFGAKIVWMSTISTANHRRHLRTPQAGSLLKSIDKERTGKSQKEEKLCLFLQKFFER